MLAFYLQLGGISHGIAAKCTENILNLRATPREGHFRFCKLNIPNETLWLKLSGMITQTRGCI